MLSKSRGQVLRVAAVLHTLFSVDSENSDIDDTISDEAMKAAVDFVRTACQQTAYVAGRGLLKEEIDKIIQSGNRKTEQQ